MKKLDKNWTLKISVTLVLVFLDFSGNGQNKCSASPSTAETMMAALTSNQERIDQTTVSTTPEPIICRKPCTSNGVCDSKSGECKCNPGWMGDRCHLCGGKVK